MATEKIVVALDASTSKYNQKISESERKTTAATRKMSDGYNKLEKTQNTATQSIGKFKVAAVAAAVAATLVTSRLISYADSATLINNKLKIATKSTEDLTFVTNALYETSNKTGTSISASADLYAKLERSTRTMAVSQDRLLSITESVNKAFAIGGATTQEAAGSIRQLGQALASGTLRGDEFNSIAEQAPIIMEAVKDATGKTAGELRELAATGALTAKILIDSLERYKNKIDTDFAESTRTFSQKMEIAENNAIKFVGSNDRITKAVGISGDALVGLSNNIDILIIGGEIAAVVFGSRLAAGLVTAGVQAAITAVAATRATVAIGAMAAAARAGSVAMALLGGPVGILLLVASSLALFVDWESKADKKAGELTTSINDQTEAFKGLNKQAREQTIAEALEKQTELVEAQKRAIEQLADAKDDLAEKEEEARRLTPAFNRGFGVPSGAGGVTKSQKDVDIAKDLVEQTGLELAGQQLLLQNLRQINEEKLGGEKALVQIGKDDDEKKAQGKIDKLRDQQEQELQAIRDRLKSEEELLFEQFEIENELIELGIQNRADKNQALFDLDKELQDKLLGIKAKAADKERAIEDKIAKDKSKAEDLKRQSQDATLNAAFAANTALLGDNKAVNQGLIVADATVGIVRQFKDFPFPIALPNSIAIAAMAATQLSSLGSSGRGGGSVSSSISSAPAPQQQQQEPETSSLALTTQSEEGSNTMVIRFAADSGDSLIDSIANHLNERQRQGR